MIFHMQLQILLVKTRKRMVDFGIHHTDEGGQKNNFQPSIKRFFALTHSQTLQPASHNKGQSVLLFVCKTKIESNKR